MDSMQLQGHIVETTTEEGSDCIKCVSMSPFSLHKTRIVVSCL